MNKKGNALVWVILIILLVIIAIGIYMYYNGGSTLPGTSGAGSIPQPPALPN